MSFSSESDARYKEKTQRCIWPFSDLVSYVMRYVRPAGSNFNVLLFSKFRIEVMEHKIVKRAIPKDSHILASRNFVGIK